MNPDDERRLERKFKCPNCQEPIVSRFTGCKQCKTRFSRDTLFSCPKCGALVRQLERVCPGCQVRLTDSGVAPEWLGAAPPVEEVGIDAPTLLPAKKAMEDASPVRPELPIARPAPPRREAPEKIPAKPASKGLTNGLKQGRINGNKRGMVNGNKRGMVNGTSQGRVNGFKSLPGAELEKPRSTEGRGITGRFATWQLITAVFLMVLLITSAILVYVMPTDSGQSGIAIDGAFADWASVPSYRFAEFLPGTIPAIIEAKMNATSDRLCVYMSMQDNAFSASNPASVYILIDSDSDSATGYNVSPKLGADWMMVITGWNGSIEEASQSRFSGGLDRNNWSAWQETGSLNIGHSAGEIETSTLLETSNPVIGLVTVINGKECRSPVMSAHGTIVTAQSSLLNDQIATSYSQPVMRVSAVAMGRGGGQIEVHMLIENQTGSIIASEDLQVSTVTWIDMDIIIDAPNLTSGEGFVLCVDAEPQAFNGATTVVGDPVQVYHLVAPSVLEVDGLFGDWVGRKQTDSDTYAIDNSNIDIQECGATTQNQDHFFYVSVSGDALGGSKVPEERSKPAPHNGNWTPAVRLKKTGEDLLRAFIDKDAGNGTGTPMTGGNKTIGADYLIEIYGTDGEVTSSSVKEWSSSEDRWIVIGDTNKIAVACRGMELSVPKSLLGSLSDSEVIFLSTDWKARSDDCWIKGALADPWTMTSSGSTANGYSSYNGINWVTQGIISLVSGDSVVDITISSENRDVVYALTNTGRAYMWIINTSSSWGSNITDPVKVAGVTITDIVGLAVYGKTSRGGYVINSTGYLWYATLTGTGNSWTIDSRGRVATATDFVDIEYQKTGADYMAIRSGMNTPVYCFGTGGSFDTTSNTGSSSPHSHIIHVGAAQISNTKIYVLCENGSIRYSADGGSIWSAFGNLPVPSGGGNSSTTYIGIDIDSWDYIWVITNSGWCYRSTTSLGSTFVKMGRPAGANIIGITTPSVIPEFGSLIAPVIGSLMIPFAISYSRKRGRKRLDP